MLRKVATLSMQKQPAVSLGFYKRDCAKRISYATSIMKSLTTVLENAANKNTLPLDIVADAGMSNIAQLAKTKTMPGQNMTIDADMYPDIKDHEWHLDAQHSDVSGWRAVV